MNFEGYVNHFIANRVVESLKFGRQRILCRFGDYYREHRAIQEDVPQNPQKKAKFHIIFKNKYILKSSYHTVKVLDMNSFR